MSCVVRSPAADYTGLSYGFIYGAFVMISSVWGFHRTKKKSATKVCSCDFWGSYAKTIWGMKGMYLPVGMHLLDQASDVASLVALGLLAWQEETGERPCENISMRWLFVTSLLAFWTYRFIGAWLIWSLTRKRYKVALQLLDLELFEAIFINFKLKRTEPCNPMRYLQSLEAVLESAPQALIQLFFVIKSSQLSGFSLNPIAISLFFSMLSVVSRVSADDKLAFKEAWQEFQLGCACKCRKPKTKGNGAIMVYFGCFKVNLFSILRRIYRFIDIFTRLSILVLIWLTVGGFALSMYLVLELIGFGYLAWRGYKMVLHAMIHTVLGIQSEKKLTVILMIYRAIIHLGWLVAITFFIIRDIRCDLCVSLESRNQFVRKNPFCLTLLGFAWIGQVIASVAPFFMQLSRRSSSERSIEALIELGDHKGIEEMREFHLWIDESQKIDLSMAKLFNNPSIKVDQVLAVLRELSKFGDFLQSAFPPTLALASISPRGMGTIFELLKPGISKSNLNDIESGPEINDFQKTICRHHTRHCILIANGGNGLQRSKWSEVFPSADGIVYLIDLAGFWKRNGAENAMVKAVRILRDTVNAEWAREKQFYVILHNRSEYESKSESKPLETIPEWTDIWRGWSNFPHEQRRASIYSHESNFFQWFMEDKIGEKWSYMHSVEVFKLDQKSVYENMDWIVKDAFQRKQKRVTLVHRYSVCESISVP